MMNDTLNFISEYALIRSGKHQKYATGYDKVYNSNSFVLKFRKNKELAISVAKNIIDNIDYIINLTGMHPDNIIYVSRLLKNETN